MNQSELVSLLQRGTSALRAGDFGDAERCYRNVLSAEPRNFDALHFLGIVRARVGRNEEAASLIAAALRQRPGAADALSNLANVLIGMGRYEEALELGGRP